MIESLTPKLWGLDNIQLLLQSPVAGDNTINKGFTWVILAIRTTIKGK
jgi:hypothetical protein